MLAPLGPGILGGTRITASGSTFTGVVLQPGLYRLSWSWVGSGWQVPSNSFVLPELNGDPQVWQGNPIEPTIPFIEGLILVTAANSVLQIISNPAGNGGSLITTGGCQLIVQQLQ